MLDGPLVEPEGLVCHAVPDFGEEPSDRVASTCKALGERDGVAESRGVPENKLAACRIAGEHVVVRRLRHVGAVGDLAHVPHQQGAGKRGLADVGVAHEAEVNAELIVIGHVFFFCAFSDCS